MRVRNEFLLKMAESKWYDREALIPFETPTKMTIVAASNGEKTIFVKKLLENSKGMFKNDFKNIYYHYGSTYQPIFDDMSKSIPNLIFKEGLPLEEELREMSSDKGHNCIVLDDLMSEVNNHPKLEKLWTVHSHHYNISILYLTQNIFEKGKAARTISLNTGYYCLFRNFRDELQVQNFGRQVFLGKTNLFMKAFRLATSKPFGYLIVDMESRSDKRFRLRTNIFPGENTIIYDTDSL